jgi:hypothetical protein
MMIFNRTTAQQTPANAPKLCCRLFKALQAAHSTTALCPQPAKTQCCLLPADAQPAARTHADLMHPQPTDVQTCVLAAEKILPSAEESIQVRRKHSTHHHDVDNMSVTSAQQDITTLTRTHSRPQLAEMCLDGRFTLVQVSTQN